MSTCTRNGVRYKRHWYDDDNVCQQCGSLSPWAKHRAKEIELKIHLDKQISDINQAVDNVMDGVKENIAR